MNNDMNAPRDWSAQTQPTWKHSLELSVTSRGTKKQKRKKKQTKQKQTLQLHNIKLDKLIMIFRDNGVAK